jgi:hypothetical protein
MLPVALHSVSHGSDQLLAQELLPRTSLRCHAKKNKSDVDQDGHEMTPTDCRTHVKISEIPVGVECGVIKICELGCDSVYIGHGIHGSRRGCRGYKRDRAGRSC